MTWKAAVSDKFKDLPLGATNIIYGARLSNRTAAEPVRLSDADFPESFDSATEWPECAQVIGEYSSRDGSCRLLVQSTTTASPPSRLHYLC